MTENFANAPVSITEARSDRDEDARVAKPRDALISVLRSIDSGQMNVDLCVVFYRERTDNGANYKSHYSVAGGQGMHDTLGMIERAKYMILSDP